MSDTKTYIFPKGGTGGSGNGLMSVLNKCDKSSGNGRSTLKVGKVTSVGKLVSKYDTTYSTVPQFGTDMVVNVSVLVDGEPVDFKKLPSNVSTADFGNGVIVFESSEEMNAEAEAMFSESTKVLESVPYHPGVLDSLDGICRVLNPQFAREKEQEEKIGALEEKIGGIEGTLWDMMGMLSKALSGNHNPKISKMIEITENKLDVVRPYGADASPRRQGHAVPRQSAAA